MQRALVLLVAAAAFLAACGARAPSPASQGAVVPASTARGPQVSCDDGGDGGVMIHGVCL